VRHNTLVFTRQPERGSSLGAQPTAPSAFLRRSVSMLAELLQPSHLAVIGAVVFLFFGGRWFARAGHGFRDAVRNFRAGLRSTNDG
jgi:hypothetical protein